MPANAFSTATAVGNREDLTDMIWNTAPFDVPLTSKIDRVSATAINHEWQRDTLRAPAANAVAEGSDASYAAVTPTQRLGNYCQIARETVSVTDTQEAVKSAGRKSDIRYQKLKKGQELKKDIELAIIENATYVSSGTRQSKGLRGFIVSNNSLGAGGVAPALPNTAPTDGTARAFTEAQLKAVLQTAYTNGSNFTDVMMPVAQKPIASTFAGNATRNVGVDDKKLVAAIDVYSSDFGDVRFVPNRVMQRVREVYVLDYDMLALAILPGRDMEWEELARTGSAKNFMVETEFCLEVREERALGAIRDLT